jgi:hypothetical protein
MTATMTRRDFTNRSRIDAKCPVHGSLTIYCPIEDDEPPAAVEVFMDSHADCVPEAAPIPAASYTRDELISLCERGLRQATVDTWCDRDSAGACQQLGVAFALLCAGAKFVVLDGTNHPHPSESHLKTDGKTIWVHFDFPGFNAFEMGHDEDDGYWDDETAYIPSAARLDQGGDWY